MRCQCEWSTDRIIHTPFSAVIIVRVLEGMALTNYARWPGCGYAIWIKLWTRGVLVGGK
jgi:hypothetical protein